MMLFSEAKKLILNSLYNEMLIDNANRGCSAEDIVDKIDGSIAVPFVNIAIEDFSKDRLVSEKYDPYEENTYQISAHGVKAIEEFIANDDFLLIAASDRIVKINDNFAEYFENNVDFVLKELSEFNEIWSEIGDDVDRIGAELRASKELISIGYARMPALVEILVKPLRYLVKKFPDAAIGAIAEKLLAEIGKLL